MKSDVCSDGFTTILLSKQTKRLADIDCKDIWGMDIRGKDNGGKANRGLNTSWSRDITGKEYITQWNLQRAKIGIFEGDRSGVVLYEMKDI